MRRLGHLGVADGWDKADGNTHTDMIYDIYIYTYVYLAYCVYMDTYAYICNSL